MTTWGSSGKVSKLGLEPRSKNLDKSALILVILMFFWGCEDEDAILLFLAAVVIVAVVANFALLCESRSSLITLCIRVPYHSNLTYRSQGIRYASINIWNTRGRDCHGQRL